MGTDGEIEEWSCFGLSQVSESEGNRNVELGSLSLVGFGEEKEKDVAGRDFQY